MRRVLLAVMLVGIAALAGYVATTYRLLGEPTVTERTSKVVVIEMTSRLWRFDVVSLKPTGSATFSSNPSTGRFANTTITVHKDDTIILRIKSLDVTHGFGLEEFNVNVVIAPGQVTEVEFVASKTGTYTFFCTVFCGTGHPNHKGTLIVVG